MLWRTIFVALMAMISCEPVYAQILTWPQWQATGNTSKQIPPAAWIVKCAGSNAYCVPEVDPVTGAIPVDADVTVTIPYSAPTGDPVPAEAAYIGGIDPSGDLRGVAVDGAGNLATTEKAYGYADSVRNDYSGTPVTTGAWVQIIASTSDDIRAITLFDSSGQTLELGTGAPASETRLLIIPPGGLDGFIPVGIPVGTRVAVRAISATASVGELNITGYN